MAVALLDFEFSRLFMSLMKAHMLLCIPFMYLCKMRARNRAKNVPVFAFLDVLEGMYNNVVLDTKFTIHIRLLEDGGKIYCRVIKLNLVLSF